MERLLKFELYWKNLKYYNGKDLHDIYVPLFRVPRLTTYTYGNKIYTMT